MKFWVLKWFLLVSLGFCNGGYAVSIEIQPNGKCKIEGKEYPVIGFGTFPLKNETCLKAVTHAAGLGYRIIDTATFYGNFEPISQALKAFGRENFYIISKVWPDSQTPDQLRNDIKSTLEQLQTTYLDAYLLHWPNSQISLEDTLQAMNELRVKGQIRHIGLSNVNVNHLKRALEVGVPISWVQIEMHPHFYDSELIEFCHTHSIAVQAWGPLGRGRLKDDFLLQKIGEKYGKTASQIALRWIVQHQCMPLPGSKNETHLKQNLDLGHFTLSPAEMNEIDARAKLGTRERVTVADGVGFTDEFDFSYEECWPKQFRLEILHGREITPYVKEIVQFINKIYREYPYFYNGNDAGYESYLESYPNLGDVIVCLAFVENEVIGIAAGLPMPKRDVYQETLLEHGYNLNTLFYLGEFGLKPEYRGQGIELTMYQTIEDFARKSGPFKMICFWEIEGGLNSEQKGYFPGDNFWKQLGFVRHPELNFHIFWTNIGETTESPHKAVYWLKNL